jgi:hypothetical protein
MSPTDLAFLMQVMMMLMCRFVTLFQSLHRLRTLMKMRNKALIVSNMRVSANVLFKASLLL